ncbi:MAG TPA: Lar family restriction alleviation protein [Oscillospiraceae bacterium]|nr:Lar family restriction alleviation protein [Oscillospiraceae bacterium]HPF57134.1 Lar family restriction alleviation protein [Clostridiales bacterium]HPK34918.1 Lar family restriction alleviation protein [Oscillospiraceae bacterium]HPR75373.1 Lar family restriction alleviation protein [Oscillospiraceae bacterium]
MYLKSCPICGGEPELSEAIQDRTGYYCECYACGKSTDEFAAKQAAADAWNRSRTTDLKDTELRGVYAIIINPFKTWWQAFIRFFSYLFGPVFVYFIVSSLSADYPTFLSVGMYIFGFFWILIGTYFYIKFFKKLIRVIRRLYKKERITNIAALVFGNVVAICAHAALLWYALIPYAELCRY